MVASHCVVLSGRCHSVQLSVKTMRVNVSRHRGYLGHSVDSITSTWWSLISITLWDCTRLGACTTNNPASVVNKDTGVTPGIMVWGPIESAFRSPVVDIQRTLTVQCYASSILCLHVLLLWDSILVQSFKKTTPIHTTCAPVDCLHYGEVSDLSTTEHVLDKLSADLVWVDLLEDTTAAWLHSAPNLHVSRPEVDHTLLIWNQQCASAANCVLCLFWYCKHWTTSLE